MISHKHNFIFIHIPKCAGSTIEKNLFKLEGLDVEFPLEDLDQEVKKEYNVGINGGQHHPIDWYPHLYQENYFTFAFVRNPWDRVISSFFYLRKVNRISCSFEDFLDSINPDGPRNKYQHKFHLMKQVKFLNDNIDYIGQFEYLRKDLRDVFNKIGADFEPDLKRINSTARLRYQAYYTSKTRNLVEEIYHEDIDMFGYSYR